MLSRAASALPKLNGKNARFVSTYLNTPLASNTFQQPDANAKATPRNAPEVTTLSNGFTVISQAHEYGSVAHLGLYVKAGSRYQNHANSGVSQFLQRLAFKNTNASTSERTAFAAEATASNLVASSGREYITYSAECLQDSVPAAVYLIADTVRNARLVEHDINDERLTIAHETGLFLNNPQLLVAEALHTAAYRGSSFGLPVMCSPHQVNKISTDDVVEFAWQRYSPTNMVLAATNYNHEELVQIAEQFFGDMEIVDSDEHKSARYVGGESNMTENQLENPNDVERVHLALAFQGASYNSKDYYAYSLLQAIIGSGSNLIGSNIGSKLSVLGSHVAQNSNIETAKAFNLNYSDTGLFGVYLSCSPDEAIPVATGVVGQLKNISQQVDSTAVDRARKFLINSFNEGLVSRSANTEFLVNQYTANKKVASASDVSGAISKVSLEDVKRVAQDLLKSKPTLVTYGPSVELPIAQDLL